MSLPEHVAEVERRIKARLAEAVEEMRRALLARSEKVADELTADLDGFKNRLPERWFEETDLARFERPSRDEARSELAHSLKATLLAFDSAKTQGEILAALLDGTRGTADRAAVWLTRNGELTGWGSVGFSENGGGDPIVGAHLAADSSPGLTRLIQGRGSIRLSSADVTRLASDLETSTPYSAALVPIVLRDRLAAALYVDRAESDVELELTQILAQSAAQRLELQALSTRSYTPTLVLEDEAPAGAAGLPLWEPEEPAEAVSATIEEVAPAASSASFEFLEEQDTLSEGMPTLREVTARAAPPSDLEFESFPSSASAAEIAWELEEADSTVLMEPGTAPAAGAAPSSPEASTGAATGEITLDELARAARAGQATEAEIADRSPAETTAPLPVLDPSPQATQAIRPGEIATHEFALPPTSDAPAMSVTDSEIAEDATVLIPRGTVALPVPPPPPMSPPPPPPPPPSLMATAPSVLTESPNEETHPSLAPSAAVDDEPTLTRVAGVKSNEVQPPPDLQGPGWAFTTARAARSTGENALHEEARRLARLLVSEIKLYNEEQVDEGRRNRDIYLRLREDIDRSRQIYEERIHESVRGVTDYFQQELVRSLAGGDARAMGI